MREILFRGRRIDNGEWIMGSLCVAENHTYIVYDMDFYVAEYTGDSLMSDRFYEVDPATVGQFTGLSDKYDCWIFEGDIIHAEHTNYYDGDEGDKAPAYKPWIGEVYYKNGAYHINQSEDYKPMITNIRIKSIEIIGNIHEVSP